MSLLASSGFSQRLCREHEVGATVALCNIVATRPASLVELFITRQHGMASSCSTAPRSFPKYRVCTLQNLYPRLSHRTSASLF